MMSKMARVNGAKSFWILMCIILIQVRILVVREGSIAGFGMPVKPDGNTCGSWMTIAGRNRMHWRN